MAAEQELTPSSYIGHHLSFLQHPVREATSGVPGKRQALVEILFEFVDNQAKDIFHGDRKFIAPVALTVGLWALLMNAMYFLPADVLAWFTHLFAPHGFRAVPTADVNT